MTWTLLETQAADRESVGLSTGLPVETRKGVQMPAGRARVSVGAWIAAAVAETCREGPHRKELGKVAGKRSR